MCNILTRKKECLYTPSRYIYDVVLLYCKYCHLREQTFNVDF